jgi:hypothetical protein
VREVSPFAFRLFELMGCSNRPRSLFTRTLPAESHRLRSFGIIGASRSFIRSRKLIRASTRNSRARQRSLKSAPVAESKAHCWHYVKTALVAAGVINSYPKTAYAAEAGNELMRSYGFKRLPIRDPYAAPIGAVLVYGDRNHGHVEIRTKTGFVSDYHSKYRCFYPLIAVYGKFGS